MSVRRASLLALGLCILPACDRVGLDPFGTKSADGGAAGAAAGSASGPAVTVPAGSFKAGTACGATPRITNEELVAESVTLGEYSMDTFPYPNDPAKPALTGVTQSEATALCAASGKRLCSELEWERACKGPGGTTFEYGASYDPAKCAKEADLLPGKRASCASGFGVKDMHGLVFEWTSSAWGRGTSGDLGTVRGGLGPAGALQARCANGQSRDRAAKAADLGFRCCSGAVNRAEVSLSPTKQAPIVAEPGVDASLAAAMLRAMPADHRAVEGADVGFDRLWRWHPRDSEEILLGRWAGKRKDASAGFFELAAFKVCGGVPALLARTRGPVEALDGPGAAADPQKASAAVSTGADKGSLELRYTYGTVKIDQPPWIKEGNSLDRKAPIIVKVPVSVPLKRR